MGTMADRVYEVIGVELIEGGIVSAGSGMEAGIDEGVGAFVRRVGSAAILRLRGTLVEFASGVDPEFTD